jgi:hypothetical protein
LVPEPFVPHPYWHFTFLHAGNVFQPQEPDLLPCWYRRFRKSFKIKILGKTAGDSPQGEGQARTLTFSANSVKKHSGNLFILYWLSFILY